MAGCRTQFTSRYDSPLLNEIHNLFDVLSSLSYKVSLVVLACHGLL